MNTQTINQRRAIHEYVANRPSNHFAERQPEPVQMCAVAEDSDPPLSAMLVAIPFGLAAWALFGWAVVTVVRLFGGAV